jgi:hypothetical protein
MIPGKIKKIKTVKIHRQKKQESAAGYGLRVSGVEP